MTYANPDEPMGPRPCQGALDLAAHSREPVGIRTPAVTSEEQRVATPGRSRMVSFVAWMNIIGGAFGVLGSAPLLLTRPSISAIVILVDAVCFFFTGLGMRARREWARRACIFVLAYTALMGFVAALRFRLPDVAELARQSGGSMPPLTQEQLDAMTTGMRPVVMVMACLHALVSGLLVYWLRSPKVRREFNLEMLDEDPDPFVVAAERPPLATVRRDDRAARTGWPPII